MNNNEKRRRGHPKKSDDVALTGRIHPNLTKAQKEKVEKIRKEIGARSLAAAGGYLVDLGVQAHEANIRFK